MHIQDTFFLPKSPTGSWVARTCETCGYAFLAKLGHVNAGKGRFCSRTCTKHEVSAAGRASIADMRRGKTTSEHRVTKICPVCATEYQIAISDAAAGRRRFCSSACYTADRASGKGKLSLTCPVCGVGYQAYKSQYEDGD